MATIGQQLTTPEAGWKRYDERSPSIVFDGTPMRQAYSSSGTYSSTLSYPDYASNPNNGVRFKFTGKKLIVGVLYWNTGEHSGFNIEVDGINYGNFQTGMKSSNMGSTVGFVKTDFPDGEHTVTLKVVDKSVFGVSASSFALDFIDIDSNGRLFHPDEVTDLADISVGKRIRCHYTSSTGMMGSFSNLGEETSDFIPATSAQIPNGDFYFILKGYEGENCVLIADRNIQNYIAFSTINAKGAVDGLPVSIIYVDSTSGVDTNNGSKEKPVKTIAKAIDLSSHYGVVKLSSGVYATPTLHGLVTLKGLTYVGESKNTIIELASGAQSYDQPLGTSAFFQNLIIRPSNTYGGDTRFFWYNSSYGSGNFFMDFRNVVFSKSENKAFPSDVVFCWSNSGVSNPQVSFINCSSNAGRYGLEANGGIARTRHFNCAFSEPKISSTMEIPLATNIVGTLFDQEFNITSDGWADKGQDRRSGKPISIGVYGGEFNWSAYKYRASVKALRLLSGGVSSVDKNNEWDEIIVGSTLNDTIAKGDQNVWNWGTVASWTSSIPITNSGNRVRRGSPTVSGFYEDKAITYSDAFSGYRPVLIIESPIKNKSFIFIDGEYKKYEKGNPASIANIITTPKMTSNTTPSGVASASSIYSSAYEAWRAFNGQAVGAEDCWASGAGSPSGFLSYKFDRATIINAYSITSRDESDIGSAPKNWTLEGSDNGTNWTVIHTATDPTGWTQKETRLFKLDKDYSYIYYRLNITSNNGLNYTTVGELNLIRISVVSEVPSKWTTISTTLPSEDTFMNEGMDNLSALDRGYVTFVQPMVDGITYGKGMLFKSNVDLTKLIDIKSINIKK
ncbi:discoidin domain-containing protein [Paenibacillus sp. Mc5Re-14]|uniref:discoidin domain-containing protein n=1 Tax=Paenibacillus sp. Mc5Re-14 TaxID=1030529 RepID=UPI000AE91473|nr:discoidin domain-containing protein [Paenibacillus sp. Mc5Re-14]